MAAAAQMVLATVTQRCGAKILRSARKGSRVIFVPGDHDEFARGFIGHHFGGVEVVQDAVHVTAKGVKLWIIHGDYFDGVIQS